MGSDLPKDLAAFRSGVRTADVTLRAVETVDGRSVCDMWQSDTEVVGLTKVMSFQHDPKLNRAARLPTQDPATLQFLVGTL